MTRILVLLLLLQGVVASTQDDPNWSDENGPAEGPGFRHGDLQRGWFELPGNPMIVENKSLTIGMDLLTFARMSGGAVNASTSYFMFFGTEFCQQQYVEARHWNDDPYQDWSFLHGCYDGSLNGTEVNGAFDVAQGRVAWQVPTSWIGSGCEVTILQPYGLATTQVLGDLQDTPFDDRGPNSGYGQNETFGNCYSGPPTCPDWTASASGCVTYDVAPTGESLQLTLRNRQDTLWNFTGQNLTMHVQSSTGLDLTLWQDATRKEFSFLSAVNETLHIGWDESFIMIQPRGLEDDSVTLSFASAPMALQEQVEAPWLTLPYVLLGLALLLRRY